MAGPNDLHNRSPSPTPSAHEPPPAHMPQPPPSPRRRRQVRDEGRITLDQATAASTRLSLKLPATRLQLDIAYKRTVNRFARYLSSRGIQRGRASWPLYSRYLRAYDVVRKFLLLVDSGWRFWVPPRVVAPGGQPQQQREAEMEPPPMPSDVLQVDREWEEMWGGDEHWADGAGEVRDQEEDPMDNVWAEVRDDISKLQ